MILLKECLNNIGLVAIYKIDWKGKIVVVEIKYKELKRRGLKRKDFGENILKDLVIDKRMEEKIEIKFWIE